MSTSHCQVTECQCICASGEQRQQRHHAECPLTTCGTPHPQRERRSPPAALPMPQQAVVEQPSDNVSVARGRRCSVFVGCVSVRGTWACNTTHTAVAAHEPIPCLRTYAPSASTLRNQRRRLQASHLQQFPNWLTSRPHRPHDRRHPGDDRRRMSRPRSSQGTRRGVWHKTAHSVTSRPAF